MTIKEILENLVREEGGTPTAKSKNGLLMELLQAKNSLQKFALDFNIADSVDLLGKKASDLQEGIWIDDNNVIHGTLFYQDDYTGFSGVEEEQSGWYLVLHADVPNVSDVTFTVSKNGGTPATLDSDGLLVSRILDPTGIELTYTAAKTGQATVIRKFSCRGLVLKKA